ncbi:MAG TPA: cyclic nucleotide-binding domain-containing protein [Actinomycetota bacterium]|nr:cyclic nucleotide-binding domain-containing protein [Actinomycetota bacterium]
MRAVPTPETIRPSRRPPTSGDRHATIRRSEAALAAVPLFDRFSKRHLRRLAEEADVVGFAPGRAVVEEGQAGEAMFVVLSGAARVTRGGRTVSELVPGDFFGELSALDGGARTASVVAQTPVEVLRLFRHTLREMIEDEPALVMGLLEGLARRLRHVLPSEPVA